MQDECNANNEILEEKMQENEKINEKLTMMEKKYENSQEEIS